MPQDFDASLLEVFQKVAWPSHEQAEGPSVSAGVDPLELEAVLEEVGAATRRVTQQLTALADRIRRQELPSSEGLTYLEMRGHILLAYLKYLAYYILLKVNGVSVTGHPVIRRLIEMRTLLSQLRPTDTKMQSQIGRLLTADAAKPRLRPRLELMGADPVPRAARDDDAEGRRDEDDEAANAGVYKPPKLVAVDYIDDAQVLLRSSLTSAARREGSRESWTGRSRSRIGDCRKARLLERYAKSSKKRLWSLGAMSLWNTSMPRIRQHC